MISTLAFLYTIFGICLVIYFLILEPIGRGFKNLEMDSRIMAENRRRKEERKRKEDMKRFIENRVPACPKKPIDEWNEEEITRFRKRLLQLDKKIFIEKGMAEDWERAMKRADEILSKYDK